MLRVLVSLALPAFLLTACGSTPTDQAYEQEDFIQNQTYSRSFNTEYQLACDAGRRALLSQGYDIDKSFGGEVTGHKDFVDPDGRNIHLTFNVTCAPESIGAEDAQVFVSAVRDSFTLKKTRIVATLGISLIGTVSIPFSSTDDALVKVGSLTITQPQFYSGFFSLLKQYLTVARLERPLALPHGPVMATGSGSRHRVWLHHGVRSVHQWGSYEKGGLMNGKGMLRI